MTYKVATSQLVGGLKKVSPALASKDFIPVLTHLCFNEGRITAFNDIIGISVVSPIEHFEPQIETVVKGAPLLGWLSNVIGKEVSLILNNKGLQLQDKLGKVNFPVLNPSEYFFTLPEKEKGIKIKINQDWIRGFSLTLNSAGDDPSVPERSGITIEGKNKIHFYSTDNVTLSHFKLSMKKKKTIDRIILPTSFCENLIRLYNQYKPEKGVTMTISEDHVVVNFENDCWLYGSLIESDKPVDFDRILKRYRKEKSETAVPISNRLRHILARQEVVREISVDEACTFAVSEDRLRVEVHSALGKTRDIIKFKGHESISVRSNPTMISRGVKMCDGIRINKRAIILTKENEFEYLISTFME